MAIKQGESVTNSKCLEWGTGVVISVSPSSAEVRFATVGPKRLLIDVLVPSKERATILDRKGRKADPQYQARLKELVDAFSTAANREEIRDIEPMIYEAFLLGGVGKAAVRRQLSRWMSENGGKGQGRGYSDARALYNFLFPDT